MLHHVLEDERQISAALAAVGDPERIWLVQNDMCAFMGVDFRCELLTRYVARNYDVVKRLDLFRSRVSLLQRRKTR
jgi:hypothetical protein